MHELGVEGVEILDRHIPSDKETLRRVKHKALKLGIEIAAVTISPSSEILFVYPLKLIKADPVKKIKKMDRNRIVSRGSSDESGCSST